MGIYEKAAVAVLGLSAALFGGAASAAPVTLTGTYVSYSFDSAALGLFGAASLSGDSLVFSPSSFVATSTNGLPAFTFQTIHVTVNATTGNQLSALGLAESGSYSLIGNGAAVGVTGTFDVLDIEGTTGKHASTNIIAAAPFNGATPNWNANAAVPIPTGWGGADGVVGSVSLTISNQLYATTQIGGTALINKNAIGISAITTPVPEAQTYAMMLAGLGLVGFMARRKGGASA